MKSARDEVTYNNKQHCSHAIEIVIKIRVNLNISQPKIIILRGNEFVGCYGIGKLS